MYTGTYMYLTEHKMDDSTVPTYKYLKEHEEFNDFKKNINK